MAGFSRVPRTAFGQPDGNKPGRKQGVQRRPLLSEAFDAVAAEQLGGGDLFAAMQVWARHIFARCLGNREKGEAPRDTLIPEINQCWFGKAEENRAVVDMIRSIHAQIEAKRNGQLVARTTMAPAEREGGEEVEGK